MNYIFSENKVVYLVLRMFTYAAHLKEVLVARNTTNLLVC